QREVHGHRNGADVPPNAVGAEIAPGHGFLPRLTHPSYRAAESSSTPRLHPLCSASLDSENCARPPNPSVIYGFSELISSAGRRTRRRPPAEAPSVLPGRAGLSVRAAERRRRLSLRLRDPRAGLRRLVPILGRTRRSAFHDVPDLMLVDRLVLHQRLGHHVELRLVLLQQRLRLVVGRVDQLTHLLVDRVSRDIRHLLVTRDAAAEEDLAVILGIGQRTD